MNAKLLFAMMSAAGMPQRNPRVTVCDKPQFTKEVMATLDQIAGMTLECVSRNPQGDCLCVGTLPNGKQFMADVDYRDIAE